MPVRVGRFRHPGAAQSRGRGGGGSPPSYSTRRHPFFSLFSFSVTMCVADDASSHCVSYDLFLLSLVHLVAVSFPCFVFLCEAAMISSVLWVFLWVFHGVSVCVFFVAFLHQIAAKRGQVGTNPLSISLTPDLSFSLTAPPPDSPDMNLSYHV